MAIEAHPDMLYRPLGRTGEKVSAIGLGGYHIGVAKRRAGRHPHHPRRPIDRGITFMDNCWDYHDGDSEMRMGKALRDGYREKVFLMTKIDGRTKAGRRQADRRVAPAAADRPHRPHAASTRSSAWRTRTASSPRAARIEALLEAQKAGKVRYIGFTGHKDPLVHLRMLEVAAEHDFHFDAVQMPLNVMDAHFRSFAQQVLPRLVKEGIGVLGMKTHGRRRSSCRAGTVTPIECLHYALNLPTSVVITGIDSMELLDQALEAVRTSGRSSEHEVRGAAGEDGGRCRATASSSHSRPRRSSTAPPRIRSGSARSRRPDGGRPAQRVSREKVDSTGTPSRSVLRITQ